MIRLIVFIAAMLASPAEAQKVRWCLFACAIEAEATDSFCTAYGRVILNSADAGVVKAVPDPVRKRIEHNDALYRCTCQNWQHPICGQVKR